MEIAGKHMAARVTFVRPGGLGDTILVLPAMRWLLEARPGARLTLVGSSWAEEIRPIIPFPVEVIRFDGSGLLPLFDPDAERDSSGVFSGADEIVLYTDDPRETLAANAVRFCGRTVLWSVTPPRGVHACDHFAAAVGAPLPACPSLRVGEDVGSWGVGWVEERFGRGAAPLAVHPGSGGRRKCWPAALFADTASRLGLGVVLLEGPADGEACRLFMSEVRGVSLAHAAGLTVPQAASILARCAAYLGNDSGMTHVAAALGIPTVAVFGPTDPAVWAPRGRRVRVVAGAAGAWPPSTAVLRTVNEIASRFR